MGLTFGVISDLISLMGNPSINNQQYKQSNKDDNKEEPYSDAELKEIKMLRKKEPGSRYYSLW